jgi:hypothetical protein
MCIGVKMRSTPEQNPSPTTTLEAQREPGQDIEDAFTERFRSYLTGTPEGFEQLAGAMALLEIERDPATLEPKLTPEGKFSFPKMDAKGRCLFEQFLSWQRCWFLWPELEHYVFTAEQFTDEQRQEFIEAIYRVRTLLREDEPKQPVC